MIYDINGNALDTAYALNGAALTGAYDIDGEQIFPDTPPPPPPPSFLDTAVLTALANVSTTGTKQGCCTDGEYIYQTAGDTSNYTYMQIIKYKISDGTYTVVRFDGTPNFGHANDMAYNPNNGYLYICTMLTDGSVIVLDSSDLSYVDTIYATNSVGEPYGVSSFCFDRLTNRFYSKASNTAFNIYDANFDYVGQIPAATTLTATAQGCETDGTYIYRVTYNPNYFDVIEIATGERVKTIANPMTGEPESLAYDWNGQFYVNRNTTGTIFYKAQLTA